MELHKELLEKELADFCKIKPRITLVRIAASPHEKAPH